MQVLHRHVGDRFVAVIGQTDRTDGDLSLRTVEPVTLVARRRAVVDRPWAAVRQVHGDRVVTLDPHQAYALAADGAPSTGYGDALVADSHAIVLAVHSGDCATVALIHPAGGLALAHGGWRGLEAGVVESAARSLRHRLGPAELTAVLGAHIHPASYRFGVGELARLKRRFGPEVAAEDRAGEPALDLAAVLRCELGRIGARVVARVEDCTAEREDRYWSHRARNESGRHALVGWLERSGDAAEPGVAQ